MEKGRKGEGGGEERRGRVEVDCSGRSYMYLVVLNGRASISDCILQHLFHFQSLTFHGEEEESI